MKEDLNRIDRFSTPETESRTSFPPLLFVLLIGFGLCNLATAQQAETGNLDIETLQQTLDLDGTEQDGMWKVTAPQNDLGVTVDPLAARRPR